jgi:hypothetical protein
LYQTSDCYKTWFDIPPPPPSEGHNSNNTGDSGRKKDGDSRNSTKEEKEKKKIVVPAYKYSKIGKGDLYESVILRDRQNLPILTIFELLSFFRSLVKLISFLHIPTKGNPCRV